MEVRDVNFKFATLRQYVGWKNRIGHSSSLEKCAQVRKIILKMISNGLFILNLNLNVRSTPHEIDFMKLF
jgi:hypothetical protein